MKRLVVCGFLLFALSASAASAWPGEKSIVAAREHAAGLRAATLLRQIPLPAGAEPAAHPPGALDPSRLVCDQNFGCRTGFWRMRAPVTSVTRFLQRHVPRTYELEEGGGDSMGFFQMHTGPGNQYWTEVVRRRGWTFVRLDAEAAWIYPRSPREVVPSTVREIDISGDGVNLVVTRPAYVAQIDRWFNQLRVDPPRKGAGGCTGPTEASYLHFTFRTASRDDVADAVVPSHVAVPCWGIAFSLNGKSQWPLIDGRHTFINRVQHLLRFCLHDAIPSCAANQHASRQWNARAIVAERKHATLVSATKLLNEFVPPPGARLVHGWPQDYDRHLSHTVPYGESVDVHRFWILHRSLASVVAFEKAHVPAGFRAERDGTNGAGTQTELTFDYPPHGITTRLVDVSISQRPTRTVVQVDALVVWVYPRSPREVLPAAVREIDVTGPKLKRRITDAATVARLVGAFNRLPIHPPGEAALCAPLTETTLRLVFRSASGKGIASAKMPDGRAGICDDISFTLGGKQQTPLVDSSRGPSFASRLLDALG